MPPKRLGTLQVLTSLSSLCNMWSDELHMQSLVEGVFAHKDANSLNADAFSDFISAVVMIMKRM